MYTIKNLIIIVGAILTATTFAADNKVVVIPLGGDDFKANGMSCGAGRLVTGFEQNGDLVCSTISEISPIRLLGRSNNVYTGLVSEGGEHGTAGANLACRTSYPDVPSARFCTADDVDKALQSGDSRPSSLLSGQVAWAVIHPFQGFSESVTSLNNCMNLTHQAGDANGTTLRIFFDLTASGGGLVDIADYRNSVACSTTLPLLCCAGY